MRSRPRPPDDRRVVAERLTWLGHATVAVELAGARLITDPVLRGRVAHLRRLAPPPDPAAVAGADAVLVSHMHFDHLDVPSLRRLGRSVPLLVPRGAGRFLRRLGFTDVTELGEGDEVDVGRACVTAVRAEHDGRRRPLGPAATTLGFAIAGEKTVYFAGDTDIFAGMSRLAGRIDVALLPVWGWGPTLGPGHMDPAAAARAVALLRPRVAVPIHWGTLFPAGLERIRGNAALFEPPREFARLVGEGDGDVVVRVLAPGDSLDLDSAVDGDAPG
jgi:L-ascorbate metabolism protein UlaG (beta-lactamase superfamily)